MDDVQRLLRSIGLTNFPYVAFGNPPWRLAEAEQSAEEATDTVPARIPLDEGPGLHQAGEPSLVPSAEQVPAGVEREPFLVAILASSGGTGSPGVGAFAPYSSGPGRVAGGLPHRHAATAAGTTLATLLRSERAVPAGPPPPIIPPRAETMPPTGAITTHPTTLDRLRATSEAP